MISCQKCGEAATIHITEVLEARSRTAEFHLCEQHAREQVGSETEQTRSDWFSQRAAVRVDGGIGFDIMRVIISEIGEQQVVYLRELGGNRRFPIVIGLFEATALCRRLKGIQTPRPLTHDAWANTISSLGGTVEDVWINSLQEHIYFATIRVRQPDQIVEFDVRPSDAFCIAVIANVPIYVAEQVVDEVCC